MKIAWSPEAEQDRIPDVEIPNRGAGSFHPPGFGNDVANRVNEAADAARHRDRGSRTARHGPILQQTQG